MCRKSGPGGLCLLMELHHHQQPRDTIRLFYAAWMRQTEQAGMLAYHSGVSAGEQSQLAVIWEEEGLLVTVYRHWSLDQRKALPPLSLTWGKFCCPFHGSEALESLTWLYSCQQYTFTQDVICFPHKFPEKPHLHLMSPKAV